MDARGVRGEREGALLAREGGSDNFPKTILQLLEFRTFHRAREEREGRSPHARGARIVGARQGPSAARRATSAATSVAGAVYVSLVQPKV